MESSKSSVSCARKESRPYEAEILRVKSQSALVCLNGIDYEYVGNVAQRFVWEYYIPVDFRGIWRRLSHESRLIARIAARELHDRAMANCPFP